MLLKGRVHEFAADVVPVMDSTGRQLRGGTRNACRGFMIAGSKVARVAAYYTGIIPYQNT